MSTNLNNINIIHTGDLHFNHPKVPTIHIVDKIEKYMFPLFEKTDMFILAGDTFESLLHMNNDDVLVVMDFFSRLYSLCEKHNVVLRILKGTGSHDRDQMKIWERLHKRSKFKCDVKYFDQVTVEYIDTLDIRIVYIPEDVPYSNSDKILTYIKELFDISGWKKADLVIGHGFFDFTLPPMKHQPRIVFTNKQFQDILNDQGKICFGHVHTPSIYENVLYCGSFDRLRHNEEEKKGFWFIEKNKPKFIENKDATLFKTYDYFNRQDVENIMSEYRKELNKLEKNKLAYVRVIHDDLKLRHILHKITEEYSYLRYQHQSKKDTKDITLEDKKLVLNKEKGVVVTEENLANLIYLKLEEDGIMFFTKERINTLLQNI
jgi:hypothetical protein